MVSKFRMHNSLKENLETGLSTNNELALGLVKVVLRNLEVKLEAQSQVR